MIRVALLLLIFLSDEACSGTVCSYQDILDSLNLTADNSVFKLTRPVLDHTRPTVVKLEILLYAILAVIEKTQLFIPFVWATVVWKNERIHWDPAHFCGITKFAIPHEILWKPDLFIYEMIEKDQAQYNPYMLVYHDGTVTNEQAIRVVSTCAIDVHKFPFDTQSCSISISSVLHSVDELHLVPHSNSSRATQYSREVMQTQSEWEFLQLSVTQRNLSFDSRYWDQLMYTFTVRRRSLLYVINFLLPILFFLCLDLASFFIPDHRGEKLGFKVTVLLAISVLLLILNEILPSTSNETPLIATYCIVIFAMMLLSLLETILVTFLMEKDSRNVSRDPGKSQGKREDVKTENSKGEDRRQTLCSCIGKSTGVDKKHELLHVAEEVDNGGVGGSGTPRTTLLLILEELRELQEVLKEQLGCGAEAGRWEVRAARINAAFFGFYICTVALFLPLMFHQWKS